MKTVKEIVKEYYEWATTFYRPVKRWDLLKNSQVKETLSRHTPKKYKTPQGYTPEDIVFLNQLPRTVLFYANPILSALHKKDPILFPIPNTLLYKPLFFIQKNTEKIVETITTSDNKITTQNSHQFAECYKQITSINTAKLNHYPPIQVIAYVHATATLPTTAPSTTPSIHIPPEYKTDKLILAVQTLLSVDRDTAIHTINNTDSISPTEWANIFSFIS